MRPDPFRPQDGPRRLGRRVYVVVGALAVVVALLIAALVGALFAVTALGWF